MRNNRLLEQRYQNNKIAKFQKAQTDQFSDLLDKVYNEVLEVGCGKGYWSYVGAKLKKFRNCFGCDVFNDFQITELKQVARRVEYKLIIDDVLPYRQKKFDLVFSMDVVEHVEDDLKFLKENLRLCKTGGEIIVGTPNYCRITNVLLMMLGRLRYPRHMGKDSYGDCIHLREYKINQLVEKVIVASGNRLSKKDIKVFPCWIGILMLNFGIERLPFWLSNYCHFFFIKFVKTW